MIAVCKNIFRQIFFSQKWTFWLKQWKVLGGFLSAACWSWKCHSCWVCDVRSQSSQQIFVFCLSWQVRLKIMASCLLSSTWAPVTAFSLLLKSSYAGLMSRNLRISSPIPNLPDHCLCVFLCVDAPISPISVNNSPKKIRGMITSSFFWNGTRNERSMRSSSSQNALF